MTSAEELSDRTRLWTLWCSFDTIFLDERLQLFFPQILYRMRVSSFVKKKIGHMMGGGWVKLGLAKILALSEFFLGVAQHFMDI